MTDFSTARKVATMISAIAEPTRLRIAFHLARGPHHVGQLAELLDIPMVNMSHHLGVMRQAGLIDDERDGRRVVYTFRPGILSEGDGNEILASLKLGTLWVVLRAAGAPIFDGKMQPKGKPKPKSAK
ncbi:MAG TPA: metalloregulator ArsR/SmtB family transcription factor [Gemmata sp.]|nr:metalloregulator ArsR/SmtB family transcription factor [Gemmata sp.]